MIARFIVVFSREKTKHVSEESENKFLPRTALQIPTHRVGLGISTRYVGLARGVFKQFRKLLALWACLAKFRKHRWFVQTPTTRSWCSTLHRRHQTSASDTEEDITSTIEGCCSLHQFLRQVRTIVCTYHVIRGGRIDCSAAARNGPNASCRTTPRPSVVLYEGGANCLHHVRYL